VTREEQLQWEARWGRPAGIGAFLAAFMLLASRVTFVPEDRPGFEPGPDGYLSIDEQSGGYLTAAILAALAALLLLLVFYYLFRAIQARGGAMPRWFVYLVYAAPVVYALGELWAAFETMSLADDFASGRPIRGEPGEDRLNDLVDPNIPLQSVRSAGTVAVAFLFVMLPLRARRVGLLSPFMGILGVITGVLVVFAQLGLTPIIEAFWLGAIGVLYFGRWPGGRGPAWESGEAEPWPTPAQRRGLQPMPGEEKQLDPNEPPPEPEPVPERPTSRKRRKKR
jgi:hypothetical protein